MIHQAWLPIRSRGASPARSGTATQEPDLVVARFSRTSRLRTLKCELLVKLGLLCRGDYVLSIARGAGRRHW
jgi:hypothetical protein